jgi:hypothetical protein
MQATRAVLLFAAVVASLPGIVKDELASNVEGKSHPCQETFHND